MQNRKSLFSRRNRLKKFRGKRRYFRNLWRETRETQDHLDFGEETWFDLWHRHLDFCGVGNSSLKIRREHIKAHIALYNSLLERLEPLEIPYQSWIELNNENAESDAVYIHTSNPNEDNFPFEIKNINWDCTVPKEFKDLINLSDFKVGQYKWESNSGYLIQSKNFGIQLI